MKTVEEIMKVTECSLEQAKQLHEELTGLPEKLGEFISDKLDVVNAFKADKIEVHRHFGYSRDGANIIVNRIKEQWEDGFILWNTHKYCFDCLIDYVGTSVY